MSAAAQHGAPRTRGARLSDAPAIAAVRVAAWRGAYRAFIAPAYLDRPDFEAVEARLMHAALADLPQHAYVAVVERERVVVGYCACGVCGHARSAPPHGGIYDLFVHPAAWRQGVGRALLSAAMQRLRRQGLDSACAFVYEANAHGRAFYARAGWEAAGPSEPADGPAGTLAVMRYRRALTEGPARV